MRSLSLGKDIKKVDEFSVLTGHQMLKKEHMAALTNHLDDRVPWDR
jgi:hypothetical protein